MKTITATLLMLFFAMGLSAQAGFDDAFSDPTTLYLQEGPQVEISDEWMPEPPSELMLRMLANDPTLTLLDYATLYHEYIDKEEYPGQIGDSPAELVADERFIQVVDLINGYTDPTFRETMAMDLLFLLYKSDADLEVTRTILDLLMQLGSMVEEDEGLYEDEGFKEQMEEVLGYFMDLFLSVIGDIFGELGLSAQDMEMIYDYSDIFEEEIIEVQ